jgi:hypothetical protein
MKRELALQLLRNILPDPPWDEDRFQATFSELGILADIKYNHYEMYQPGRLFFENLYAWLSKFSEPERTEALEFITKHLIFISREEFQQLTQVLYHDKIRQSQLDITAEITSIERFKVKELSEHETMARIERASLYVAMSDGARIDYFRRQNLSISNEQVLPTYFASATKIKGVINELQKEQGENAKFKCLYLIDDFSASGRTLLRETITEKVQGNINLEIPKNLQSRISFDLEKLEIEFSYRGYELTDIERQEIISLSDSDYYQQTISKILDRNEKRDTKLKGSLIRLLENDLSDCLSDNVKIFLCPLLITEYALNRLTELIKKIDKAPLNTIRILPSAIIPGNIRINAGSLMFGSISELCEKYYDPNLEDEHTGNVKYGYDNCGLPVVLHHNTPNNSIYLLWARKWQHPLFVRYERHGRQK